MKWCILMETDKKKSKWEKFLFWSLVVLLIGGIADLLQMAIALTLVSIDSEMFWSLLTDIRIQSVLLVTATGFLLIYERLKCQ